MLYLVRIIDLVYCIRLSSWFGEFDRYSDCCCWLYSLNVSTASNEVQQAISTTTVLPTPLNQYTAAHHLTAARTELSITHTTSPFSC